MVTVTVTATARPRNSLVLVHPLPRIPYGTITYNTLMIIFRNLFHFHKDPFVVSKDDLDPDHRLEPGDVFGGLEPGVSIPSKQT